jgi:hypothetical protein
VRTGKRWKAGERFSLGTGRASVEEVLGGSGGKVGRGSAVKALFPGDGEWEATEGKGFSPLKPGKEGFNEDRD